MYLINRHGGDMWVLPIGNAAMFYVDRIFIEYVYGLHYAGNKSFIYELRRYLLRACGTRASPYNCVQ